MLGSHLMFTPFELITGVLQGRQYRMCIFILFHRIRLKELILEVE